MHNSSRYTAAQWRCAPAITTGLAGSGEEHRRGLDVPREKAPWVSPVFDDRVPAFLLRQCDLGVFTAQALPDRGRLTCLAPLAPPKILRGRWVNLDPVWGVPTDPTAGAKSFYGAGKTTLLHLAAGLSNPDTATHARRSSAEAAWYCAGRPARQGVGRHDCPALLGPTRPNAGIRGSYSNHGLPHRATPQRWLRPDRSGFEKRG
jgi:hypothetical protein